MDSGTKPTPRTAPSDFDPSLYDHTLVVLDQFRYSHDLDLLATTGQHLVDALEETTPTLSGIPLEKLLNLLAIVISLQQAYVEDCDNDAVANAVLLHRRHLLKVSEKPTHHPFQILNLSDALYAAYSRTGDLAMLTEAIMLLRQALSKITQASPIRIPLLGSLAFASTDDPRFFADHHYRSEIKDLVQEALKLAPSGHPFRHIALVQYGWVTFYLRMMDDNVALEPAIEMVKEALSLRSPGHPLRQLALSCYANILSSQYDLSGDDDFLTESFVAVLKTLELRPPGHHRRACTLANLAGILIGQFELFGGFDKLREASRLAEEAIALASPSSPSYPFYMYIAGESLKLQGYHSRALSFLLQAGEKVPDDDQIHGSALHDSIAKCLVGLSEETNDVRFISEAIESHEKALLLRPQGSVHHTCSLLGLADTKILAYKQSANRHQLTEAIHLYQQALQGKHRGHPMKATTHYTYAKVLLDHSTKEFWEEALDHISIANTDDLQGTTQKRLELMSTTVNSIERVILGGSKSDVALARKALTVYMQAIRLLPRAAHLGMSMSQRLNTLQGTEHLCRVAAIRALLLDDVATAVESLEEGRNVFWTQALRLRPLSLDRLPHEEQQKLEKLLRKLDYSIHVELGSDAGGQLGLEKRSARQRQLNSQVQSMLDEIRSRPGFSRFMTIEPFGELAKAADNGIIVLLLATEVACYAILMLNSSEVKPVQLHNLNISQLRALSARCESTERKTVRQSSTDDFDCEERLGIQKTSSRKTAATPLGAILDQIWRCIIHPITTELGLSPRSGRNRPRIYWCPVGEFARLPLHAACSVISGIQASCVSDFAVSSYIPSLSTLIKARKDLSPFKKEELRAFLVAESHGIHRQTLLNAEKEVNNVANIMALSGVSATVDTKPCCQSILKNLASTHILHLVCHGVQTQDALESHFVLRDGKLSIADLAKLTLPHATLAFLGACETAKGDLKQPDQAIHLAASMLFCGFRSVIGTMWTMNDYDGPAVATSVYTELLEADAFELDHVPYALDQAVQKLRKSGAPPSRWATFVHMGA